jgi:hypothetical protein
MGPLSGLVLLYWAAIVALWLVNTDVRIRPQNWPNPPLNNFSFRFTPLQASLSKFLK